jgi:hypothetical protein
MKAAVERPNMTNTLVPADKNVEALFRSEIPAENKDKRYQNVFHIEPIWSFGVSFANPS